MNPTLPYRKTAKGQEALGNRQSMSPKMRSVMIMVDGKRTGAELEKIAAALGDPGEILGQLEAEGFLEPVAAAAPVAAPAAPAASPAPAAAAAAAAAPAPNVPRSLGETQRFAVRFLNDRMGPMAEGLCIRIEEARNLLELQNAIMRARDVVREVKGDTTATQFFDEARLRMPPS